MSRASLQSFTVIGQGRIGKAISRMLPPDHRVIMRGDTVSSDVQGPILICTTCDALPDVYSGLPPSRKEDAVFLANGMLLRFFAQAKIEQHTQVLLYMSADDEGNVSDGRQSAVTGKWAAEVCQMLAEGGISCEVLDRGAFTGRMVEKLLWASVMWLVCHAHGGITVGEACEQHRQEITNLIYELYPIAHLYALEAVPEYMQHYIDNPTALEDILDSFFAYSTQVAAAVPSADMARSEFAWRNGFFLWRQPTLKHVELLKVAGFNELVDASVSAA